MEVEELRDFDSFLALRDEWDALLEQSPINDAFLTWEWLATWWKHYGHRYQLRLLTARENGELVGIAPLMLEQRRAFGVRLRVLRNIGVPPPDVGGFIVRNGDPEVLVAFGEHLVTEAESWDILSVREIPGGVLDMGAFVACFPASAFAVRLDTTRHFYVPIEGDWETFFQGLSKNLRKDLRKKVRRLEEQSKLTFCRYVGRDATQAHMRTVFEINEQARHTHLYRSPVEQAFHLDLAQRTSERGWLDISFLCLDGKPVAYRYGFLYNDCFEDWRTAFDTQYYSLSVGKVLLMFLLQDCFERRLRELHFLRGDEDYKERWQVTGCEFVHPLVVQKRLVPMLSHVWVPRAKRLTRRLLSRNERLAPLLDRYDRWRGNK